MSEPCIFIVLVNYNKWEDTLECLESVFKLNYNNFKIIVVDNGSQNDSFSKLKAWASGEISADLSKSFYEATGLESYHVPKPIPFTEVQPPFSTPLGGRESLGKLTLVKSPENLGFAGGNNLATRLVLSQPEGDFIWYLNNDTVVEKETLTNIVGFLKSKQISSKPLGIVGTKLIFYNHPNQLQGIGGQYNKWLGLTKHVLENCLVADSTAHDVANLRIDYPIGASMVVQRAFLKEVGLMSEEYFLYFEEIDWAERAKRSNWEVAYFTDCRIYHKESASIGSSKDLKSRLSDFYGLRNRLIITKKFFPACLPFVYLSFIPVILNRLKRKQFDRILMILEIMVNPGKKF